MNETLYNAAALIIPLILAIVFHEVSHGWVADLLGDPTARERRRLSLNPVRHVDPIGTVILPGALALAGAPVFGWAKPVPVMKERLDNPRVGMMAVAAAGPGTNLVLAAVGALAVGVMIRWFGLDPPQFTPGHFVMLNLFNFIMINIFLALFNLLPIPPFDGSHIVEGLLPRRAAAAYERLRPFGFPLVFAVLIGVPLLFPELRLIERFLLPPVEWLGGEYLSLAGAVAGL